MVYNLAVIYKKILDNQSWYDGFSWPTFLSQDQSVELGKKMYATWDEHPLTIWTVDTPNFRTPDPLRSYAPYIRRFYDIIWYTHIYVYIYIYVFMSVYIYIYLYIHDDM